MKMLVWLFVGAAALFVSHAVADDAVFSVQSKLKRLGYYNGVVDGQMGSQTAAAIRRFQIAQRLKVTGELNSQTLRRLGVAAPGSRPLRRPSSATIFKGGPFISVGPETQITVIRQAQKNLQLLGYYRGPIDGMPSRTLMASLKAWQRSAGFRQTGRFDENTLKGLALMPEY
jgi:peptidoglycan hydrolase-like protein with peptidoglycan-binding domain